MSYRLTKATREMLAKNVARGAKRLDQRHPNWYKQIVAKDLDLSLACNCVLGQVYGDYDDYIIEKAVGYTTHNMWHTAANYGFNIPRWNKVAKTEPGMEDEMGYYRGAEQACFHALDKLWIAEVKKRRAADRA